ncbi:hypothetical protein [Streptomyces sp. NPDC057781]
MPRYLIRAQHPEGDMHVAPAFSREGREIESRPGHSGRFYVAVPRVSRG